MAPQFQYNPLVALTAVVLIILRFHKPDALYYFAVWNNLVPLSGVLKELVGYSLNKSDNFSVCSGKNSPYHVR